VIPILIIHVLGLTVVNYLIAIAIILETEFLPVRHMLSVASFCILTFVTTALKAFGCHLHTQYCFLFPLPAQTVRYNCNHRSYRLLSCRVRKKWRNDWEWWMSCLAVLVLCMCFPWVLCIKEFSDGGICSNFRAACEKTIALLTCCRWVHCGALWLASTC
jgi:hypothetical protein